MGTLLFALATALAPTAHALECEPDDALTEAAANLLLDADRAPGSDALARAAREAGSAATAVHALRVADDDEQAVERWLSRMRARADAPLSCGEARGGGQRLVLVAPTGGALVAAADDEARLTVEVGDGFSEPHLVIRAADGSLRRVAVDDEVLARGIRIPDELPRPVEVQLVAEGSAGPRPIAQRVIGAVEVGGASYSSEAGTLEDRVSELRALHDVSPLRPNRLLDQEAERHARRVCRQARVAHQLEDGLDPEERLRQRGIGARVVGEAVARARSDTRAFRAIVESPSHLMTVVDRRFTDGGYGQARSGGRSCVVVLLAAWPRVVVSRR